MGSLRQCLEMGCVSGIANDISSVVCPHQSDGGHSASKLKPFTFGLFLSQSLFTKKIHSMNSPLFKALTISLAVSFLFSACGNDENPLVLKLRFAHEVSDSTLALHTQWYDCAAGHKFQVHRLKYYVSDFAFHRNGAADYEPGFIHLVDLDDVATLELLLIDVPEGEFTGLSFVFGLDENVNVDGGLPNTTTNINMEWPIPGDQGYHYMKFEGEYDSLGAGSLKNFNLHFGATGGNQNYVTINLNFSSPVDLKNDVWVVNLIMDLNEWLQNPNVYDFEAFGPMIMTNQAAQQTLKENGADVFKASSIKKE